MKVRIVLISRLIKKTNKKLDSSQKTRSNELPDKN